MFPIIKLTSMDGRTIVLNAELIEKIENVPETMITLSSGKKNIVLENVDDVISKVVNYKRSILTIPEVCSGSKEVD